MGPHVMTVAHETCECVRWSCDVPGDDAITRGRIVCMADDAGWSLRVAVICQPFVLVRDAYGKYITLDLRQHHFAHMSKYFGEKA